MKFLALETDIDKIKCRFLCQGEREILTTYYHGLSFFFAIVREIFITMTLFIVGVLSVYWGLPIMWTLTGLFVIWLFFVFFNVLKAWIDWNFDFIFVTSDKVVLVDQTSIVRQKINPIHIENIGSVTAETQFWGMFPFGVIQINLKEGEGGHKLTLPYVPRADEVASKISEVVTHYQRKPRRSAQQQQPPQA